MGNQISLRPSDATMKVVFYDGSVQEFDQQITVAELMLEHPQQVVVEFHSAMNQKRPTPLPADKNLEMNNIYLMLPVKQGKPVCLSNEESRRIMLMVNSSLHSKYLLCSSRFLPWFASLCHGNGIVEPGMAPKKEEMVKREERCEFSEILTEVLDGRPEYLSRQISGKGWKPSLDTIKEKNIEKKFTNWLFLKNF